MDEAFRLDGKVAAVIGAGSGIGEAVAVGAGKLGARVVCLDVESKKAEAVARGIGREAEFRTVDIRDGAAVQAVFDDIKARHDRLDIAICTPSINVRKPILAYAEEELERVLDVNVKGNFNVLRAAGRVMTAQGKGNIVLFSSIRSLVVEPGQAVYAATKAAIVQLVR
ncbi:MAG TPA: SDR family oxidoreductase, partial [Vicinamibacteria bacterium]